MFVAAFQSQSNNKHSRQANRSSQNVAGLSSKPTLRRPNRPILKRPDPLPPDIGAGSIARQPQKQMQDIPLKQTGNTATLQRPASTMRTGQDSLVDYLIRARLVKSSRVAEAMRAVDRAKYINPAYASKMDAYSDHPLSIGEGQTISAPHMHAICLELLEKHLKPGARVLDVGSGSGYLTACMAKLVSPDGAVLGVDKVPELVVRSQASLQAANPELLEVQSGSGAKLVNIKHGNALSDMLSSEASFNAIHVGAAADELHQILLDKLAPGGRMVIPVGPHYSYQVLMAVDKDADGKVTSQALMDVGYVPLTRPSEYENGQLPGL